MIRAASIGRSRRCTTGAVGYNRNRSKLDETNPLSNLEVASDILYGGSGQPQ